MLESVYYKHVNRLYLFFRTLSRVNYKKLDYYAWSCLTDIIMKIDRKKQALHRRRFAEYKFLLSVNYSDILRVNFDKWFAAEKINIPKHIATNVATAEDFFIRMRFIAADVRDNQFASSPPAPPPPSPSSSDVDEEVRLNIPIALCKVHVQIVSFACRIAILFNRLFQI